MIHLHYLTPVLAVAGALAPTDFAELAHRGFRTVINNRPDDEEYGQLAAREAACLAGRSNLAYHHIPAAKHEVLDDHTLEPLAAAVASVAGAGAAALPVRPAVGHHVGGGFGGGWRTARRCSRRGPAGRLRSGKRPR